MAPVDGAQRFEGPLCLYLQGSGPTTHNPLTNIIQGNEQGTFHVQQEVTCYPYDCAPIHTSESSAQALKIQTCDD